MTQKQLKTALMLIFIAVIVLVVLAFVLFRKAQATSQPATSSQPVSEMSQTFSSPTQLLTALLTPTQTVSENLLPSSTSAPQVQVETPTTLASLVQSYPESFYIKDITGHRQVYSLGCEASVSVDWAGYFDVPIIEYTFQVGLPLSDNPDYGFVGDVNSPWGQIPPYGYGVHAEPVADLLVSYGLPAKAVRNYSIDELKQKLSESKPAIVWVIGNMEWSEPVNYTDSEGRVSVVAPFEHVVIATGYDADSIRYMSNGKFYDTPTDVFERSWGVLGNMAVIYDK
jgi:uncharacterized protein YvpB